jgi:hypothetical protein
MLQKVLQTDDFLKVSSARRLVNISGTVRAIDTGERYGSTAYAYGSMGLLERHRYYSGRNCNQINISGTKGAINLTFLQGE